LVFKRISVIIKMPSPIKTPEELRKRIEDLEKGHGKLMSIRDELRIISMEYSDIRSRIEMTDVLIDRVISQMEVERKMRRLNMVLIFTILALTAFILMKPSMGF